MYDKHVEVVGGEMAGDEAKGTSYFVEGRRKDGTKMRQVVLESKLSALFRRDYELCGAPTVRIRETTSPVTMY